MRFVDIIVLYFVGGSVQVTREIRIHSNSLSQITSEIRIHSSSLSQFTSKIRIHSNSLSRYSFASAFLKSQVNEVMILAVSSQQTRKEKQCYIRRVIKITAAQGSLIGAYKSSIHSIHHPCTWRITGLAGRVHDGNIKVNSFVFYIT